MAVYKKPWLSVGQQMERLRERGVEIGDTSRCAALLGTVGYYRLTGYLYPFRETQPPPGGETTVVRNTYREGTSIGLAFALIEFDRDLRLLVLDGMERIETSLRTQIGHALGRISAFAHLDRTTFVPAFVERASVGEQVGGSTDAIRELLPRGTFASRHDLWIDRMRQRQSQSNEKFVVHFRERYDNQMPIWTLTEIMELGQLARLYGGLNRQLSETVAHAYNVPTKKILASWIASLNYVRNVSAHHARLFNRSLQYAPARPPVGRIPMLDHLRDTAGSKAFGVYHALAVMAYLLRSIEPESRWACRVVELVGRFPSSEHIGVESIGGPVDWTTLELWSACPDQERPHPGMAGWGRAGEGINPAARCS